MMHVLILFLVLFEVQISVQFQSVNLVSDCEFMELMMMDNSNCHRCLNVMIKTSNELADEILDRQLEPPFLSSEFIYDGESYTMISLKIEITNSRESTLHLDNCKMVFEINIGPNKDENNEFEMFVLIVLLFYLAFSSLLHYLFISWTKKSA